MYFLSQITFIKDQIPGMPLFCETPNEPNYMFIGLEYGKKYNLKVFFNVGAQARWIKRAITEKEPKWTKIPRGKIEVRSNHGSSSTGPFIIILIIVNIIVDVFLNKIDTIR